MNNEYTLLFKRGAFDMGCTVCPIAIKYNKMFVDGFWNRCRDETTTGQMGGHGGPSLLPISQRCFHLMICCCSASGSPSATTWSRS